MKSPSPLCIAAALALGATWSSTSLAQLSGATTGSSHTVPTSGLVRAGSFVDNVLVRDTGSSLVSRPGPLPTQNLGGFSIVIVPGSGLAGNSAALAAFNRAAQGWAARMSDPITITINANLAALGSGIIGGTSSVGLEGGYAEVRNAMVADAAADGDDGIVASLPTLAQFNVTAPAGTTLFPSILINKANAKALGFAGLDQQFGTSDGTITFSSNFSFDFDRSNGITPGTMDFETVAAHEIGHLLGFVSYVDSINGGETDIAPTTLDLFRFANDTSADPATAAQFTTFARNLVPGVDTVTDQIFGTTAEWRMSTGLTNVTYAGTDGRQASHWKDGDLTGQFIGAMDPTLAFGQTFALTDADFRAFDLIGYDIAPIPEAATAAFGLSAALATLTVRRRRFVLG